jgi:sigma-E factor negative regulatory protein RseC
MNNTIEHPGIVKEIINKQKIVVSIVSTSACSQCHSKVACTMNLSEIKEKEIEVEANAFEFPIGTKVIVQMRMTMGLFAVFLTYIMPLFLLITTVIITFKFTKNEGLAGFLGLFILVPYFLLLYYLNDKIKKRINFTIKKCS